MEVNDIHLRKIGKPFQKGEQLRIAAEGGNLEVLKYLLEKGGAEVNVKNHSGRTALELANSTDVREWLNEWNKRK